MTRRRQRQVFPSFLLLQRRKVPLLLLLVLVVVVVRRPSSSLLSLLTPCEAFMTNPRSMMTRTIRTLSASTITYPLPFSPLPFMTSTTTTTTTTSTRLYERMNDDDDGDDYINKDDQNQKNSSSNNQNHNNNHNILSHSITQQYHHRMNYQYHHHQYHHCHYYQLQFLKEYQIAANNKLLIETTRNQLEDWYRREFLKRRPVKLPYNVARQWVQANLGVDTKEEFDDFVANGIVRTPYIPKNPEKYYTQTREWISWDHFLTGIYDTNNNNNKHPSSIRPATGIFD